MEWIIEKAAELGATRLVPVLSERTVVKVNSSASSKLERWRQTAVTALKQCGGPWLMELTEPMPFARALAEDRSPLRLVGALRPPQHSIRACCESHCATTGHRPAAVSLWIGPEGDFTSAELDAPLAQGAHPVVFCDQVLRAETAAIAALAVLVNEVRPPDAGGVHFGAWGTA